MNFFTYLKNCAARAMRAALEFKTFPVNKNKGEKYDVEKENKSHWKNLKKHVNISAHLRAVSANNDRIYNARNRLRKSKERHITGKVI